MHHAIPLRGRSLPTLVMTVKTQPRQDDEVVDQRQRGRLCGELSDAILTSRSRGGGRVAGARRRHHERLGVDHELAMTATRRAAVPGLHFRALDGVNHRQREAPSIWAAYGIIWHR